MLPDGLYRFDHFYFQRIFGQHGYYQTSNGVGSDFETIVTTDPGFAKRLGSWIDSHWESISQPATLHLYEIGSGDGNLYHQLRSLDLRSWSAITYHAIDFISSFRDCYPADVVFLNDLPATRISGLVFGNEFLDQQPFRFMRFRKGIAEELFVEVSNHKIRTLWNAVEEPTPIMFGSFQSTDMVFPWLTGAQNYLDTVRGRLSGKLLLFDYGVRNSVDFYGRKWLRCYKNYQERNIFDISDVFDMSSYIAVDQLLEAFPGGVVNNFGEWLGYKSPFADGFWAIEWQSDASVHHRP